MSDLSSQLERGLRGLGEDPESHPLSRYLDYIDLLLKWNRAYNLTGARDRAKVLSHHVLDSLSVLPYIQGTDCLDIGTGAGLPGLILALARPAQHWVLLDGGEKKIRFVRQALMTLEVKNAEAVRSRMEDFDPDRRFTTVISRALWPLPQLWEEAGRVLVPDGVALAMKGPAPEKELTPGLRKAAVIRIQDLQVPGVRATRKLVILHRRGARSPG